MEIKIWKLSKSSNQVFKIEFLQKHKFKQFWKTATVRTLANGTQQLVASIDSKEYTITEVSVRSKLQLADATGIHNLFNAEIYARFATLSPKSGGWDQFGSTVATALICLSSNRILQLKIKEAEPHHTLVDLSPPLQTPPHPSPPHPSPLHHSPPHSPLQSPLYSPPHYLPPRSYKAPLPKGNTSGSTEDSMQLKELMDIIPRLVTRIETLETELQQTKTTYGKAVLTLVKRDIDDDSLVSLVRESMKMKEKSTDFVTPTKALGEAQKEDIGPIILETAKTLSKVASYGVSKEKSTDKGKRYRRRARSMAKKIDTGLDAKEEINTSREEINTGIEEVRTGSTKVNSGTASKRVKGKERLQWLKRISRLLTKIKNK
ncbi:hypothetical protein Tco_0990017 [Tanacetum coccineum]|uniref:Uncharacterized protein n=1 Tax=Tanacetum coccineum TaxID=301880 RepID=A0ABQ5EW18_9ASTR